MTSLRQELLKLQVKHKDLLNERKIHFQKMKQIKQSQRYIKDQAIKQQILSQSKIQSQKSIQASPQKKREPTEKRRHSQQKSKQQSAIHEKLQQKQNHRNRRMMGLMSSYLVQAKNTLKGQQDKFKHKMEIQNQIKQQQQEKLKLLREEKKMNIEKQKIQAVQNKLSISNNLLQTENQILLCKYNIYLESLNGYCTKTNPPLFWKPSIPLKQSETEEKIKDQFLKTKFSSANKLVQSISNPEQYVQKIIQSKNIHYQTIYSNHLKSYSSFIKTQHKPQLFWKPSVHSDRTQKLLKITESKLKQQAQKPIRQLVRNNEQDNKSESEEHFNKDE